MTAFYASAIESWFPKRVRQESAYVPEWLGLDRSGFLRLDRNESTLPIPATVAEVLIQWITRHGVHAYPDSERLMTPLAQYCGVPSECILPTNGSDQAIDLTLRSILSNNSRMLVATPEFSIFGHIARTIGTDLLSVPYYENLQFPYKEFREAAAANSVQMIVIINPNNPTGTSVQPEFIDELATSYPHIPIVVDEAYYEYTGDSSIHLVPQH